MLLVHRPIIEFEGENSFILHNESKFWVVENKFLSHSGSHYILHNGFAFETELGF